MHIDVKFTRIIGKLLNFLYKHGSGVSMNPSILHILFISHHIDFRDRAISKNSIFFPFVQNYTSGTQNKEEDEGDWKPPF